jgi:PKD repeat protein
VDGNVFHYDGTSWTRVAFDVPIHVNEIWGSSATDVYFAAADTLGHAAILHYDGTYWRLTRSPIPYGLGGIWGAPTGEVFATGDKGTIVRGYRGGTVAVTPSSATITGNANQLQLVPSAAAGGGAVAGVTYLWTSGDETVATVDADGLVTGLASGTATITATAFGGAAATATVTVALTQTPPVALIDLPRGDTLLTLGEAVDFQGTATDVDGTIASHHWDFGDGTGASVEDPGSHTYAAVGIYQATYRVTDDDGATSSAATVVVTVVANQAPTASIASPAHNATFSTGETITFTGSATDHEDGALTGASLVWTSSLDGQIGTGTSFTRSDLSEGTHGINLNAKDSGGVNGATGVVITVRSRTPLYLRYATTDFLSNQPATSGYATLWLYGSGQSAEFQAILGNAITGTGYGFSLWLGSGTGPGQTGTWTATILVEHDAVQTTLAAHTFTVPYSTSFVEYTADVTGIPGGAVGDKLILRLTMTGVSEGAVRFGVPPVDSHILVPGNVMVSMVPSPQAVSAAGEGGVRVEVGTGLSVRYPGR